MVTLIALIVSAEGDGNGEDALVNVRMYECVG